MNKNIEISRKIAAEVSKNGGRAYYVGGFVRDRLLGRESSDIDIEVHGIQPFLLEKILDGCGTRIEVGKSFGIYNIKNTTVDIAVPRSEKATGRGHRDFKICTDPYIGEEKAARRRDFTVNAMMCDVLSGEIKDFFGGRDDLKNKIIRHIDGETFREDPLRVLRAARFSACLGFKTAEETKKVCALMDISYLSKERVAEEIKKAMLFSEKPSVFFETLKNMSKLGEWFFEAENLIGVPQNPKYHGEGDVWNHTMLVTDNCALMRDKAQYPLGLVMSGFVHDFGKAKCTEEKNGRITSFNHEKIGLFDAENFLRRIFGEKKLIKYVLNMTELHMRPNALSGASIKAYNRLFDKSVSPHDLILLSSADSAGSLSEEKKEDNTEKLNGHLKIYREYMERPYVTGDDLIAAGVKPGKEYANIMRFAHNLRLCGVDKENALRQTLSYAKELTKN